MKSLPFIFSIMALLILPLASSEVKFNVEEKDLGSVVFLELNNPAIFNLTINNLGEGDNGEIYTLVGVSMAPKGTFQIPTGKSTLEIMAYPGEYFKKREGIYSFEYNIRAFNQGIYTDKLTITVVSLKDSLEIGNIKITPGDTSLNITISNKVKAYLDNIEINLKSSFFDTTKKISLKPLETINLPIEIIPSKEITKLNAGTYIISSKIIFNDVNVKFESILNYLEKEGISVESFSSGILIRKNTIQKTNEGNIPIKATIEMRKDIISRLFTTYSESSLSSQRKGIFVNYFWEKTISPQESFIITSSTNYTFPFIIIVLIVLIALLVWFYSLSPLAIHKSVSYVKTAGGEFALKVRINVKARKNISNVLVTDRLPHMTKLYEKFGRKPDKIDHESRQLHWNIPYLNKSEERVFSYIIYSHLRTVGKFELPIVRASYVKDGEKETSFSNRVFFISETLHGY